MTDGVEMVGAVMFGVEMVGVVILGVVTCGTGTVPTVTGGVVTEGTVTVGTETVGTLTVGTETVGTPIVGIDAAADAAPTSSALKARRTIAACRRTRHLPPPDRSATRSLDIAHRLHTGPQLIGLGARDLRLPHARPRASSSSLSSSFKPQSCVMVGLGLVA